MCALWCPDWPVVAARRRDPGAGRRAGRGRRPRAARAVGAVGVGRGARRGGRGRAATARGRSALRRSRGARCRRRGRRARVRGRRARGGGAGAAPGARTTRPAVVPDARTVALLRGRRRAGRADRRARARARSGRRADRDRRRHVRGRARGARHRGACARRVRGPAGWIARVPRAVAGDGAHRIGRRARTAGGATWSISWPGSGCAPSVPSPRCPRRRCSDVSVPPACSRTGSRAGRRSTSRWRPFRPRSCSSRSSSIHLR